jgi:hypothetical protein
LKEKPILFSTLMVQAILEDRKSKTRRVCKPQPVINLADKRQVAIPVNRMHGMIDTLGFCSVDDYIKHKAHYQVGDIMYVLETWKCNSFNDKTKALAITFKAGGQAEAWFYDADRYEQFKKFYFKKGWQSPYFMPQETARLFLRITEVRAEQLQDITEEDAQAEGVKAYGQNNCSGTSARIAFAELWDGLNEKRGYGWRENPWVWVYTFERCEKPGGAE